MAEYIDRDGAYPLAKKICDAIDSDEFQRLNFGMRILDWIDDIPAADVRPVVMCRDCMMRQYCKVAQYLGADGFCSNGEKMEES